MRKQFIFYLLIIVLFFSCKNDKAETKISNPFEHIETVENQVFNLDKMTDKEVIGNKGTKIYFSRNDFEVGENDVITLELKEYYSLEELISENIQTVTLSKKLLESNGVIYLNFMVDGKKISLREDKKLRIQFPIKLNKNDRIYMGEIDSNKQIYWTIDNNALTNFTLLDSTFLKEYGVEKYKDILIPIDSLAFYKNKNKETRNRVVEQINIKYERSYFDFFVDDFGWLNIDRIINPDAEIDFELISNNNEIEFVNNFILYEGLNSFINYQRKINELSFKKIPLKNETSIVIIGKKDNLYYADKIDLNINTKGKIELNLKIIDSTELKSLIKK